MDLRSLLSRPSFYQGWQRPFVEKKMERPIKYGLISKPGANLLEVGCGPGTNFSFLGSLPLSYVGIDLSNEYIDFAKRAHKSSNFRVGDVTKLESFEGIDKPDCILANSLLHHLSDEDVESLFTNLKLKSTPLTDVHIVDLVLPSRTSLARALALADRGGFARPEERWLQLLQKFLTIIHFESFDLMIGPLVGWKLFYLKGKLK